MLGASLTGVAEPWLPPVESTGDVCELRGMLEEGGLVSPNGDVAVPAPAGDIARSDIDSNGVKLAPPLCAIIIGEGSE